jgi:hypothetical protein
MKKKLVVEFLHNNCGIVRIRGGQVDLINKLVNLYKTSWNSPEALYISSSEAQRMTNKYRDILDASCYFKGYSSRLEGVCDRIIGWREEFVNFCIRSWEEDFKMMRAKAKADSALWLRPGSDKANYTQTDKSCRYYAKVQNMPRKVKEGVYKGCIDADMVNCHAQLFWRHILKGDYQGNQDMQQCIESPEAFLGRISDSNAWSKEVIRQEECPRKRSKRMRSKLFNPPNQGKPRPVGCDWYDNLAQWILERLESAGIDNCHKYFTAIEQECLADAMGAVGNDNVVVNMHDGFILDSPQEVTPTEVEKILNLATGMPWKCVRY